MDCARPHIGPQIHPMQFSCWPPNLFQAILDHNAIVPCSGEDYRTKALNLWPGVNKNFRRDTYSVN
jgi:hypothetical protein